MPPAALRNYENARSALECGGLTPPWDRPGPPGTYAERKGGVKPPHSEAPAGQAFSEQDGRPQGPLLHIGTACGRKTIPRYF